MIMCVLPGVYTVRAHYYRDARQDEQHPTRVVTWRVVVVVNESTPAEKRTIHTGQLAVDNPGNSAPGASGGDWATVTQVTVPPPE